MEENKQTIKKNKKDLTAILSYLGILFLIPLLVDKDKEFKHFHAKQGMVLFIAEIITAMFAAVPVLGWFGAPILYIAWLILSIIGITNVLEGNKKELPYIGHFADKFNI